MEEIKDPQKSLIKVTAKSILIGRLPREGPEKFKTAVIRAFNVNNPHKTTTFPIKTLEFSDTEKIQIINTNLTYYLEGNDMVINNLVEAEIKHEDNKLVIEAKQE